MKKLILLLLPFVLSLKGQTNYVADFNVPSYIDAGTTVGTGVRSIEFWFKPGYTMDPSAAVDGWTFISRDDNTEFTEYGLYLRGSDWTSQGDVGKLCFWVRYSGVLHEIMSNQNTWTVGVWYHIAGVLDPSSGMKMYVNGVLQSNTDPSATAAVMSDNLNPTYLGTWGGTMRFFYGRMEEMRIWDRAISQSEIQAKMCQDLVPSNETGLRAYWKFNEGSGSQVLDLTANSFNGVVNSSSWAIDSPCGATPSNYALSFNGVNNNDNMGNSAGNGVRTIDFWFKPAVNMSPSTTATGWTLISRDDNTQFSEYGIYIRGTDWTGAGNVGKLCFWIRYSGTLHEIMSNQNTWTGGTWYHVAGVLDPTSGMKLFINGTAQTNIDASATSATMTDNSSPVNLGSWGPSLRFFNGRMDEMRLWNRALSPSEIQAKMCQDLTPANETGLQAYWKFDEGSGSQLLDETVNAFTGTVNGTTWIADAYCAIGIKDEPVMENNFVISPNPGTGVFTLNFENNYNEGSYQVFDVAGKRVTGGLIIGGSKIDLSDLENGIYFISVLKDKQVSTQKIIIQK